MRFLIKRYFHGVGARWPWLLFVFLPPLVYLGLSFSKADRFSVKQDIGISKESPVASTTNPVDYILMRSLLSRPDAVFEDSIGLRELYGILYGGKSADHADEGYKILIESARRDLTLSMPDNKTATISYYGGDRLLGETMVRYYSRRLVKRAQAGLIRKNQRGLKNDPSKRFPAVLDGPSVTGTVGLVGTLDVKGERALWRPERAGPAVEAFVLSLIAVLVLLGVLEWSDPAFKSERQIARYLGVPILGSLPDLTVISDALSGKATR